MLLTLLKDSYEAKTSIGQSLFPRLICSDIGNLEIDKDEIKRVSKTKYLGLTIYESLSGSQQYRIVKGKLKGELNSVRKL